MKKRYIEWGEILIRLHFIDQPDNIVYGVPKGGMILTAFLKKATVVYDPNLASIILDDLIDSGATEKIYREKYPDKGFFALYNKRDKTELKDTWLVFPWEADHPIKEDSVHENIVRQLQYIGEDPNRQGLKDTPNRIVKSWKELYGGYEQNIKELFTIFDSEKYDEMILLKEIEMFSMCEHHQLPFFGKAHIAYIPNGPVLGVSKLARILDAYSRRLQIQERIGNQVTEALMKYLKPLGAACIIEACHMCMRMRGVSKQNSTMVTSSLKGVFLDKPEVRAELFELIK